MAKETILSREDIQDILESAPVETSSIRRLYDRVLEQLSDQRWQDDARRLEEALVHAFAARYGENVSPQELLSFAMFDEALDASFPFPGVDDQENPDPLLDPEVRRKARLYSSEAMMRGMPPLPFSGIVASHPLFAMSQPPRKRGERGPAKVPRSIVARVRAVMDYYLGSEDEAASAHRGGFTRRQNIARKYGMSDSSFDRLLASKDGIIRAFLHRKAPK